jgi:hypothetical protein
VRRVRRPPGRGRLERPVARRPRLGGGLIRQRLACGVIAALRALAGHRQAQRGEQPGRCVGHPGALGLEQRERLLRPLRPDRQKPSQPHRHFDALGRRVRRQQGQDPAQYLARVARPPCRDQRSRLSAKQRQATRSVLGGLGQQPQRRLVPARGRRRRGMGHLLRRRRQQVHRGRFARPGGALDMMGALGRRSSPRRQRLGCSGVRREPPPAPRALIDRRRTSG